MANLATKPKPKENNVRALKLERARDELGEPNGYRAIVFEIYPDGPARVYDIWQSDDLDALLETVAVGSGPNAIYLGAYNGGHLEEWETKIGNHVVSFPDAISLGEAALAHFADALT